MHILKSVERIFDLRSSFEKNRFFRKVLLQKVKICSKNTQKMVKSESKIFKKSQKIFFLKMTPNVLYSVQSGPKPLPGPQNMVLDHPTCLEWISQLFWKIEISTVKSIFCLLLHYNCLTGLKKGVWRVELEANLFHSFRVFAKPSQGSNEYDHI